MKIATLKAQAKNLQIALAKQGIELTRGAALEAVAQQYGLPNWDTLAGLLKVKPAQSPTPTLADLPGSTDLVDVELGVSTTSCEVGEWDEAVIALLHKPDELQAFIDAHPDMYEAGMASEVLTLYGDGEDFQFTIEQLQSGKYVKAGGRAYWHIPEEDTYLSFPHVDVWESSVKQPVFELTVPELVKTAKGVTLVALRSVDGWAYDHYVLVPPHLDAKVIVTRLVDQLTLLKKQDADNESDSDSAYEEYTDKDLETFVATLGCEWVSQPEELGTTWD